MLAKILGYFWEEENLTNQNFAHDIVRTHSLQIYLDHIEHKFVAATEAPCVSPLFPKLEVEVF